MFVQPLEGTVAGREVEAWFEPSPAAYLGTCTCLGLFPPL